MTLSFSANSSLTRSSIVIRTTVHFIFDLSFRSPNKDKLSVFLDLWVLMFPWDLGGSLEMFLLVIYLFSEGRVGISNYILNTNFIEKSLIFLKYLIKTLILSHLPYKISIYVTENWKKIFYTSQIQVFLKIKLSFKCQMSKRLIPHLKL